MAGATNVAELAIRIRADGVDTAAKDLGAVEKAGEKAGRSLEGMGRAADLLKGALAALGLTELVGALRETTHEVTSSTLKLESAAKIAGVSLDSLKLTSRQTAAEFKTTTSVANDLTTELTKLAQKSGDVSKTGAAIGEFLNIGASRGLSAAQTLDAVKQAILGIDEGTDKLFSANPSVIYAQWAAATGHVASTMTDAQKATALLWRAHSDGLVVGDAYAKWLDTADGKLAQLDTKAATLKQRIVTGLTPAILETTSAVSGLVDWVGEHGPLVTGLLAVGAAAWAAQRGIAAAQAVAAGGGIVGFAKWLASPAGAIVASIAAAAGTYAYASSKEAEIAAGPGRRAAAIADALPAADVGKRLASTRGELAALEARYVNPSTGANPEDVERINTANNALTTRVLDLQALVRALEARVSGQVAPPKPKTAPVAGAGKKLSESDRDELEAMRFGDGMHAHGFGFDKMELDPKGVADTLIAANTLPPEVQAFRDAMRPHIDAAALERDVEKTLKDTAKLVKELDAWRELRTSFGSQVADSIGGGLADGIRTAVQTGDIGAGFKALGGALVGGLGSAMVQFGEASLKASLLMTAIQKGLASFLPGGSALAAVAMIALGATLQGVAGRAFGNMGGGGGGGASFGGVGSSSSGGLTDRGFIGSPSGLTADGMRPVLGVPGGAPSPAASPAGGSNLVVMQPVIIGPNDPAAQRGLVDTLRAANARGLRV